MTVMGQILTALIGIARSTAHALGYQTAVVLSEQTVKVKILDPDSENVAWDPSHYLNTNVFLSSYANPVEPEVSDGEVSLVPSERYKRYMDQHLLTELVGEGRSNRKIMIALLVVVGLQATVLVAIGATYFM